MFVTSISDPVPSFLKFFERNKGICDILLLFNSTMFGEMDDARFALEFLSRRYPGVPAIIAGFSFGSYVGLRVGATDDRVYAMIGLGVPARMFDGETLQNSYKPKLFIHGTQDELAPYELMQQWFEQVPAPKQLVMIEGADHFFQGRLEEMQAIITEFVRSLDHPAAS